MGRVKKTVNNNEISSGDYEAKVIGIEEIISRIETGELNLEEVFQQFAQAVESLQECQNFLQKQQQQVDLLIETLQGSGE